MARGKRIALIGYGAIGEEIAASARRIAAARAMT